MVSQHGRSTQTVVRSGPRQRRDGPPVRLEPLRPMGRAGERGSRLRTQAGRAEAPYCHTIRAWPLSRNEDAGDAGEPRACGSAPRQRALPAFSAGSARSTSSTRKASTSSSATPTRSSGTSEWSSEATRRSSRSSTMRAPMLRASACASNPGCAAASSGRAPRASSRSTLATREHVRLGGDHTVLCPSWGPPFVHDLDAGRATRPSATSAARADPSRDPLAAPLGGIVCEPVDIPANKRHFDMLYHHIRYSDRPFMGAFIARNERRTQWTWRRSCSARTSCATTPASTP